MAQWVLCVPPVLIIRNSAFFPQRIICIMWFSEYAVVVCLIQCFKVMVLVMEILYLLWGMIWCSYIIYMNLGPQSVKIQQNSWWHFMKCWDWNWLTVYIFYSAVYEKLMNKCKSEKYYCNYFIYLQNAIILFSKFHSDILCCLYHASSYIQYISQQLHTIMYKSWNKIHDKHQTIEDSRGWHPGRNM